MTRSPGHLATILLSLCAAWTLATPCSRAGDESGATRAPKPPSAPRVAIPPQPATDSIVLSDDSIYAQSISIDMAGVHIVTREGKALVIPAHLLPPPHRTHDGGVHVEIDWADNPTDYGPGGRRVDLVQIASNIHVAEDETVHGDAVCIFCDIVIDGRVVGSAVSIFGGVQVNGTVEREAIAPFGHVRISSEGNVKSDVFASRVKRDAGGMIGGTRQEMPFNLFGDDDGSGSFMSRPAFTILIVIKILFWLFLVLLAQALAAKNIAKVKARIQTSYVKSFFMGILGQVLVLPVFLLLLVTIIGIPVAIFVLPLMIFFALILSQAAVGHIVGEKLAENTSLPLQTPLSRMMIGVAILQLFAYLAMIFIWPAGNSSTGAPFRLITVAMVILSGITDYAVFTLGTGAVLLTRWGTRPKDVAIPVETKQQGTGEITEPTALPGREYPSTDPGAAHA